MMDSLNENYCLQEREEVRARCAQEGIDISVVFDELSPGLWTHM